jgi:hypothetical protein
MNKGDDTGMPGTNRAEKNGLKAFETVERVLTAVGWQPEETDYEGVLRIDFSSDNIPVSEGLADVRIEYERFLFYLSFRDRAPVKQRREVMTFLTRANYDLVIGNFEFNLDDGGVRFKSSIDFTNVDLSETLIRNTIRSSMDAVEQYADALVMVIRGELNAQKALDEAEAGQRADRPKSVPEADI